MNAVPLSNFTPGSPEWMSRMTASKVSAVLGLSPWESRFSLWHRMAGLIDQPEMNEAMTRGHYLEDGVARWFADQHPEYLVAPGGAWAHPARDWQAASPDRLLRVKSAYVEGDPGPHALLEIKTAASDEGWGEPGTDEIPPGYRAQVAWQMDCLGVHTCHVAVLTGGLRFAEYRIEYNADEATYIREEARAFLDSLPGGPAEQRPNLDGHSETYAAVKALHPEIDGTDFLVPDEIGREFCDAVKALKAAEIREATARTVLADAMGNAKRAMWLGKKLADRRPSRNGGTPYMQASSAERLPIERTEENAA